MGAGAGGFPLRSGNRFFCNKAFLARGCRFELQTEERDQLKNERHLRRGERGGCGAVPRSQRLEFSRVAG